MKKNGFTLVELMAVIVILGTLGIIVTVNLFKSLNDTNKANCKEYREEVERVACSFAGISSNAAVCNSSSTVKENGRDVRGCNIPIDVLIKSGYVKEEKNPCAKNGEIDKSIDVKVRWVNNEKKCTYEVKNEYE